MRKLFLEEYSSSVSAHIPVMTGDWWTGWRDAAKSCPLLLFTHQNHSSFHWRATRSGFAKNMRGQITWMEEMHKCDILSFGVFLWALWLNPNWQAGMGNYGLGDKYLFSVFYHPSFAQHLFICAAFHFMQNLTSLRKLDLDDNRITVIPTLPSSLEELKIKNNKLSGLTPHCFKGTHRVCVSCVKIITGVTS